VSYIYLADVWCDDCGRAICKRLKREGKAQGFLLAMIAVLARGSLRGNGLIP
jgi:hypothetical protein